MACNENVIKNMASEVSRDCQARSVNVEVEFVVFLMELLLVNPKYGKLFAKSLNRSNLEYFVKECVDMLTSGETPVNTLKMQFLMSSNYDKLQNLVDRHVESIETCLRPLVVEILEAGPESREDAAEFNKLYRKISIYIVLASGLGNPGVIVTLKEGMSALESVFTLEDLHIFVALPRPDKLSRLKELLEIVSGVRLFNRDCKLSGDGIPDLPFSLVDAGKACLASLSHSLMGVMQRVNLLTTAVSDSIGVQEETGNVFVDVPPNAELTEENYKQAFDLLSFNRQYEVFIRLLLSDVEALVDGAVSLVSRFEEVLATLHAAVKYKEAVPVVTVYPLFSKLWQVWRSMQNTMYVVSTVNLLMQTLASIQERTRLPLGTLDAMLRGRAVMTDQERMTATRVNVTRMSLGSLKNYQAYSEAAHATDKERSVHLLGFCAVCLAAGALVPGNLRLGLVRCAGRRYAFCSVKMAERFSRDPHRYVNEVLHYARSNPHLVHLLNIAEDVRRVRHVECLVVKCEPGVKVCDKEAQTEVHPLPGHKDKDYTWNLWEWKKRACQWATIVNCKTHSTQTHYSHLRSEVHCQTVEPRDKCLQTVRHTASDTGGCSFTLWGLRSQMDHIAGAMDLERHPRETAKASSFATCAWPCYDGASSAASEPSGSAACAGATCESGPSPTYLYEPCVGADESGIGPLETGI